MGRHNSYIALTGRRGRAVMASTYGAKGPKFKTCWRQNRIGPYASVIRSSNVNICVVYFDAAPESWSKRGMLKAPCLKSSGLHIRIIMQLSDL